MAHVSYTIKQVIKSEALRANLSGRQHITHRKWSQSNENVLMVSVPLNLPHLSHKPLLQCVG